MGRVAPDHDQPGPRVSLDPRLIPKLGTGYKIVFIPFEDQGRPEGHYEDFVRGFLLDPQAPTTWGRPAGVALVIAGVVMVRRF